MIALKNIVHTIGRHRQKTILRDVSATIRPGTLTAIMGLNGSGKTTLLNIMSGITSPTSGEVRVAKKNSRQLAAREKARLVSHVPQDFNTDFPFTVMEFILMSRFAWQRGWSPDASDQALASATLNRLEIGSFGPRQLSSLSGGEKQRVLIARTLLQNTPIILLDEPLNHLDIKSRQFILNLLHAENHSAGKTIVAVLHDPVEVRRYFDEVLLLKNGALAFHGPVSEGLSPQKIREVFEIETP